jgi:hypothetical protein
MHDPEHQNSIFTVLPLYGTFYIISLTVDRTAMIIAVFFIAGVFLIGGAAWLGVLFEQAPCGFQCDKHGYFHGNLNACPKCGNSDFPTRQWLRPSSLGSTTLPSPLSASRSAAPQAVKLVPYASARALRIVSSRRSLSPRRKWVVNLSDGLEINRCRAERMKGIRANLAKQQAQTVQLPMTPPLSWHGYGVPHSRLQGEPYRTSCIFSPTIQSRSRTPRKFPNLIHAQPTQQQNGQELYMWDCRPYGLEHAWHIHL